MLPPHCRTSTSTHDLTIHGLCNAGMQHRGVHEPSFAHASADFSGKRQQSGQFIVRGADGRGGRATVLRPSNRPATTQVLTCFHMQMSCWQGRSAQHPEMLRHGKAASNCCWLSTLPCKCAQKATMNFVCNTKVHATIVLRANCVFLFATASCVDSAYQAKSGSYVQSGAAQHRLSANLMRVGL